MKKPKILFYDIETTPFLAGLFQVGHNVSVSHENILPGQHSKIICVGYKWDHEKEVKAITWNLKTRDCEGLIRRVTRLIESADVAIAHNGDKFDVRHLNTQRLLNNLPPIAWPTTEDTLKQLRKIFYLPSYRLDYITKLLFGAGKKSMVFQDWLSILLKRDKVAYHKMIDYCKHDVDLLAKTFNRVKRYLPLRANVYQTSATIRDGIVPCKACGSVRSRSRGRVYKEKSIWQKRVCVVCGKPAYIKLKTRIKKIVKKVK